MPTHLANERIRQANRLGAECVKRQDEADEAEAIGHLMRAAALRWEAARIAHKIADLARTRALTLEEIAKRTQAQAGGNVGPLAARTKVGRLERTKV